ncbi:MAG: hypothetical protein KJO57_05775 [Deltaproteobacteria bacterium]|nr:hypothetical protein [Deltaproteobacteria bacterium]NNK41757.1 hypothetical protein [Myxococcales bacterium]
MNPIHIRRLAPASCLALLVCLPLVGCGEEPGSSGGTAGGGGMAGEGGVGGIPAPEPPQLWEGESRGVGVCFSIAGDGSELRASPSCSLSGESAYSFDLEVELIGVDENGQPCSFALRYQDSVPIDQDLNSFRASEIRVAGDDAVYAFSGELVGELASGIAVRNAGESNCRVGWSATISRERDCENICVDLLECCAAILINPVFFQTCNSVVQECDQVRCQTVLDGYPQCAPEP